MVSVEDSNIKGLSLILSSQRQFDAAYFTFREKDILDVQLMSIYLELFVNLLKGHLKINVFIGAGYQTYVYVRASRPQTGGEGTNNVNEQAVTTDYFVD
jgi:hypothetical protein